MRRVANGTRRRIPARRAINQTTYSAVVSLVLLLVLSCPWTVGAAAETEPLYYTYHGQPKPLTLDGQHIAVHVKGIAPETLPGSLTSRGIALTDVESRPLPDWVVVRAGKLFTTARTNTVPGATNTARTESARVHTAIRTIATAGDPSVDFVSPVFRDTAGNPILVTSRILIGFDNNLAAGARSRIQGSVPEVAVTEQVPFPQPNDVRWQIQTNDGFAVLARANALAQMAGVTYAEPDMIATAYENLVPSDPSFAASWALRNTGQSGGQPGFDMAATSAWDVTLGSSSVIVVVMDTGVQQSHPDINQIPGRDFTSDQFKNPSGGPVGVHDNHGTLVAGCISERINNGKGTAGIAPGVAIASARCVNNGQANGSFSFEFSWFIDALNWGQSIGARVSNNSGSFTTTSSALEAAYTNTHAAGMVHFAAAGNDSVGSIDYPASIAVVNAVGSVNRFGQRSSFSNFGSGLRFVAPGEQILTTDRTGSAGESATDYATVSGTSFSSPYAAGVAALIISLHPSWTADEVERALQASCRNLGSVGYNTEFGYGIVDAFRAVTMPLPTPTPSPTPTPPPTPTPTPTPTPPPTPTPSPTPTPTPFQTPPPQPVDQNNILVSIGSMNFAFRSPLNHDLNIVREFTPTGDTVQTLHFFDAMGNTPPENFGDLRGIACDQSGFIDGLHLAAGTALTRYSPTLNDFEYHWLPRWGMVDYPWDGAIAAYGQYIFLSDLEYNPIDPEDQTGVVRFDTLTGEAVHFAEGSSPDEINIGLDGKLYISSLQVQVYDPITLTHERDIFVPWQQLPGIRGFAVDQTGTLFLCGGYDGTIWRINSAGVIQSAVPLNAPFLNDIQVDASGRLIVGELGGRIFVGDTSLTTFQSFYASADEYRYEYPPLFLSFARPVPTTVPTPAPITRTTPPPTNYSVTRTESVPMIHGLIPIGLHCSTCATHINLPFDVSFYDRVLPAGSSIGVSSNGFLFLEGDGESEGVCLPAANFNTIIAPEWGNFSANMSPTDGVFMSVGGTAPLRSLFIEWRVRYSDGTFNNFEVVFYESQHHIDFVYGTAPTHGFATIGVQRGVGDQSTIVSCGGDPESPVLGTRYSLGEITISPQVPAVPSTDLVVPIATFVAGRPAAKALDFTANLVFSSDYGPVGRIAKVVGGPGVGPYTILGPNSAFTPASIRVTDLATLHSETYVPPSPTPSPTPPITPTVTVFAPAATVAEGGSASFLISLLPPNNSRATTVHYSISGNALAGSDYIIDGQVGSAIVPAGSSSAAVTVHTVADNNRERSEKVTLTLLPDSGYLLPRAKASKHATITIVDQGGRRNR